MSRYITLNSRCVPRSNLVAETVESTQARVTEVDDEEEPFLVVELDDFDDVDVDEADPDDADVTIKVSPEEQRRIIAKAFADRG